MRALACEREANVHPDNAQTPALTGGRFAFCARRAVLSIHMA